MQWRPIDEAPKDQWILVYDGKAPFSSVKSVFFGLDGVWYEGQYGQAIMGINGISWIRATHWADIPDPPLDARGRG